MSADRLKTDSIKSPVMPDKEHKNPNKTLLYKGPGRISGQFFCAITHVRIENKQRANILKNVLINILKE